MFLSRMRKNARQVRPKGAADLPSWYAYGRFPALGLWALTFGATVLLHADFAAELAQIPDTTLSGFEAWARGSRTLFLLIPVFFLVPWVNEFRAYWLMWASVPVIALIGAAAAYAVSPIEWHDQVLEGLPAALNSNWGKGLFLLILTSLWNTWSRQTFWRDHDTELGPPDRG